MKRTNIVILLLAWPLLLFAEQMPVGYYDNISDMHDDTLKATLRSIIRNHNVLSYGSGDSSSWECFYYADRDTVPDSPTYGKCMDMYCDDWKPFGAPGTVVSGCNVEHSFAKSWWGGCKTDPYRDCYHLNPSNSNANSARSNYPLGIPEKEITTSGSLRIGKRHHDGLNVDHFVFEPKDKYKGDFARAYFYMATCYGHDLNGDVPDLPNCDKKKYSGWRIDNDQVGSKYAMQNDNYLEFQDWEIEVLIAWHRMDPVSGKELQRLDKVSDYQHNRNPFIEYPCLAEYIWGNRKGQRVDLSILKRTTEGDWLTITDPEMLTGCNCGATAIELVVAPKQQSTKILREGRLYIVIGDNQYNVLGQRVL